MSLADVPYKAPSTSSVLPSSSPLSANVDSALAVIRAQASDLWDQFSSEVCALQVEFYP